MFRAEIVFILVVSQTMMGDSALLRKITNKALNVAGGVLSCYENPNSDGSCPYDDITFWLYTRNVVIVFERAIYAASSNIWSDADIETIGAISVYPYSLRFQIRSNWSPPHERSFQAEGIRITDENMNSLPLEPNAPWKIIFHGHQSEKDDSPGINIRPAYFSRGPYNILQVDCRKLFMVDNSKLCYSRAAHESAPLVAKCSADFFKSLMDAGVLPSLNNLHIIGHSMGAHTAGFTAARLNRMGIGTLRRLTGLDPAGPLFENLYHMNASERLNSEDATFVDAYHTNRGEYGILDDVGTVDISFNGGTQQPGCNFAIECNHQRAVDYFAESICSMTPNKLQFYGLHKETGQQLIVGEDISTDVQGEIIVHTNAEPPYARGCEQI